MYDNVKRAASIMFTVAFLGAVYAVTIVLAVKLSNDVAVIADGSPLLIILALSAAGLYTSPVVLWAVIDTPDENDTRRIAQEEKEGEERVV